MEEEKKFDRRTLGNSITAFGKTYLSTHALARDYGVNKTTLVCCMKKLNVSAERAIYILQNKLRPYVRNPLVVCGNKFPNKKAVAKYYNLKPGAFVRLLRNGMLPEDAVDYLIRSEGVAKGKKVIVDGLLYPSKTEAAKQLGLNRLFVTKCLKLGINDSKSMLDLFNSKKRDLRGIGYVYLITNKVTNKKYVGITSKTVAKRYKQHLCAAIRGYSQKPLYTDMRKFGIHCFSIKTLLEAPLSELAAHERRYIKKYQAHLKSYNVHTGGSLGGYRDFGKAVKHKGLTYLDFKALCASFNISLYRSDKFLKEGRSINWIVKEGLRWNNLSEDHQKAEANGTLFKYKGINYSVYGFAKAFNLGSYTTQLLMRSGYTPHEVIKYFNNLYGKHNAVP